MPQYPMSKDETQRELTRRFSGRQQAEATSRSALYWTDRGTPITAGDKG